MLGYNLFFGHYIIYIYTSYTFIRIVGCLTLNNNYILLGTVDRTRHSEVVACLRVFPIPSKLAISNIHHNIVFDIVSIDE